eukprot:322301_1
MSDVEKECDHPECNERNEHRIADVTPMRPSCSKSMWNFVAVDSQLDQNLEDIIIGKNRLCVKHCCGNFNSWKSEDGGSIYISKSIRTTIHLNCNQHYCEEMLTNQNHCVHSTLSECNSYCTHLLNSTSLTACDCAHYFQSYPNHTFKIAFYDNLPCKNCQIILAYLLRTKAEKKMNSIEKETRDPTDKLVFVYTMCNLYIYCLQQAHTAKYVLADISLVMRFVCIAGETMAALCMYLQDPVNRKYTKVMAHCYTKIFIKFIELLLNHSAMYISKLYKMYNYKSLSDWKLFHVIQWFIIEFVIGKRYILHEKRIMKPLLIFWLLFREKKYDEYACTIQTCIIQKYNQTNVDKCVWLIRWLLHSFDGVIPYSQVLYDEITAQALLKHWCHNLKLIPEWYFKIAFEGVNHKILDLYLTNNPLMARNLAVEYTTLQSGTGIYTLIKDFHKKHWKGKSVYKYLISIDKYSKYLSPHKNYLRYDYVECQWRNCCNKKMEIVSNGNWGKCSKCKLVRYCSKHCQKLDWKLGYHKKLCFGLALLQ